MPKQNTAPSQFPHAVLEQIELLGQNIAIARKRRGESQVQWAQRLGVSQPTMARIEQGDPAVSMAFYAMAMWLINPALGLADLVAPQSDLAALDHEIRKVRATVRPPKKQAAKTMAAPFAATPESFTTRTQHAVSEPVLALATNQPAQQPDPSANAAWNQALGTPGRASSLLARAAISAAEQQQAATAEPHNPKDQER